jgi:2-polyprenyl-3-methyl-5-hydroxy-6-metoxy-1,4-benzoquinol methylase
VLKLIKCNLCGCEKYSILYKTYSGDIINELEAYKITEHNSCEPVRVVKCNACGLIYANPRPEAQKITDAYINMVDDDYLGEEAGRRMSARSILGKLSRARVHGRLLDIGCATGFLLDEARKSGWNVHGVELSAWAADYAKTTFVIDTIFRGTLDEARYSDNYFDAIILKDSIEHLLDPKATLVEIRRILKPSGVICVNTPDCGSAISKILKARWWGIKQSHLYYFNRKTLWKMLDAAGFKPVKTIPHARSFSVKYWFTKLKGYNNALYKIAEFLLGHEKIKNRLITVNLGDQIEVYARKIRRLEYLDELEKPNHTAENKKMKVIAVLPAYNAAKTLKKTVDDIPKGSVDEIILVDDCSKDNTVDVAKSLGLKVYSHRKNKGYGANQKTCYRKALEEGAGIVVMVHPDYQYDPKVIPKLVEPIKEGRADAVFGSRMMKGGALEGGMPPWKHNANILLTALENVVFGTFLTEYHSGFRAYSARLLKTVKFDLDSDGFIFDTEIIAQIIAHNFKIEEVPIKTRYFDEASTIRLWPSILYGCGILKTLCGYILHTCTPVKSKKLL